MSTKIKAPRGISHTTITINGKRRKLRYCNLSTKRAKAAGLPLSKILEMAPVEGGEYAVDEITEFTSAIIWLGLLAFEPDLSQDDFDMELQHRDMEAAAAKAMPAFEESLPSQQDAEEEGSEEEEKKARPALRRAK